MNITCTLPTSEKHFGIVLAIVSAISEAWKTFPEEVQDLIECSGVRLANESYDEFEIEVKMSVQLHGLPTSQPSRKFNFQMPKTQDSITALFKTLVLREIESLASKHHDASQYLAQLVH